MQHTAHGLVVLGEIQGVAGTPHVHEIAASVSQSGGVNCKVAENLIQAHWEKLVWNIPFNGLGVAERQ